jgi:hypothetical protein
MPLIASLKVLLELPLSIRVTMSIFASSLRFSYIGSRTFCTKDVPWSDSPDSTAAIVRKSPVIPVVITRDITSYGNPLNSVGGGLCLNLYSVMWARYSSTLIVISTGSPSSFPVIVFGVCPISRSDNVPVLLVSIEIQIDPINAKWVLGGWNRS